jgi:hypothetical protein
MIGHDVAAFGCSRPRRGLAGKRDLLKPKARLVTDHSPGAALTFQAMAHSDARWFALNRKVKLPAAAGGASGHWSTPWSKHIPRLSIYFNGRSAGIHQSPGMSDHDTHKTLAEVERYTRAAEQERLARRAIKRQSENKTGKLTREEVANDQNDIEIASIIGRMALPTEAREPRNYNWLGEGLGHKPPIESQYIPPLSPKLKSSDSLVKNSDTGAEAEADNWWTFGQRTVAGPKRKNVKRRYALPQILSGAR